ncbi:MAG: hypothetical protein M0036_16745 [Desulfobacteraceae bacterium]|nr:hypothetical protein [Desulfobacteraceae bacterium]
MSRPGRPIHRRDLLPLAGAEGSGHHARRTSFLPEADPDEYLAFGLCAGVGYHPARKSDLLGVGLNWSRPSAVRDWMISILPKYTTAGRR